MAHKIRANIDVSDNVSLKVIWHLTRMMKAAGWTYKASGNGTSKETTGVATSDLWGGDADPTLDTYPPATFGTGSWWCAQGPTTIALRISAASTGTFSLGEKVTQATSGAIGEISGYMWVTDSSNSFIVVHPRTGTFNANDTITGASSGATVTLSGTMKTYVREVVFWRDTTSNTNGSIYYFSGESTTYNTSKFSYLATQSNCTATVAPGGATGNNAFPGGYQAFVVRGQSEGATVTHDSWFVVTTGMGKAQVVATDVIGTDSYTPDGTFWVMLGYPGAGNSSANTGLSYMRVDDVEPGDTEPFLWFIPASSISRTRTYSKGGAAEYWSAPANHIAVYFNQYYGPYRLDRAASDLQTPSWKYIRFGVIAALGLNNDTGLWLVIYDYATKTKPMYHPLAVGDRPTLMSRIWAIYDFNTGIRGLFGKLRWMYMVCGGNPYDTWDNKNYVQVSAPLSTSKVGGFALGPWDGSTGPEQT